ncbi:MAG TPA: hypothetical protein V6D06_13775 [Trichocoleus sp.]
MSPVRPVTPHPSRARLATWALLGTVLLGSALPPALTLLAANPAQAAFAQARSGSGRSIAAQPERRLPSYVRNRVLRHAAQGSDVQLQDFYVVSASAETWSDSCLGIPDPVVLCAAVQTPGWRVVVSDGQASRAFRTDRTARVVLEEGRPIVTQTPEGGAKPGQSPVVAAPGGESEQPAELPRLTTRRILEAAAETSSLPMDQITISAVESRTWDGCFGLPDPEAPYCTMIGIPGWRVVVTAPEHVWVYHSNQDGSEIRLNEAASQLGDAAITPRLLTNNQDYSAEPDALFSAITSGGIAGQTTKTVLFRDGRLVQYPNGSGTPTTLRRLSPQALNEFIAQMQLAQLDRFQGLGYEASGTADTFTVTLMPGPYSITQYDETLVPQLPEALQQVIQTWESLSRPRSAVAPGR